MSGHLIQAYILLQRARESLDDPMVEELADQGEVGVGVPVLRIGYALHVMLLLTSTHLARLLTSLVCYI